MATYYSHSGKFALDAPFTAFAAGVPAALALSWLYAYAILYIPIIGVVTFILTGGLGVGVGLIVGLVLQARKVRNRAVAWVTGLGVGVITLWLSWVSWIVGLLRRGDEDVSWLGVLLSPDGLWQVINKVNEVGAWSFKGATPTGGVLWVMWGAEALIIVGVIAFLSAAAVSDPYCEACGTWTEKRQGVATSADTDLAQLRERLERKDFDAIKAAGEVSDPKRYLRYDLHECSTCGETNTLCVATVVVKEKDGKVELEDTVEIANLLMTRSDVARVGAAKP